MKARTLATGAAVALAGAAITTWALIGPDARANAPLPDDPVPAATAPVLRVSVVQPVQQAIDDEVRVTGSVVPRENVVVMSELAGLRVKALMVEVGDRVRKGQPVALLDGEGLQIDSSGLRSEYERTRDEYDRIKEMLDQGIVSKEVGRQRQAAAEVARARLEAAQLSIRRTQVLAPASGLVYERPADVGTVVGSGEPLMRLARDGEVEVEASVPESQARRLKPGMAVQLTVAGDDQAVAGTVRQVLPVVDAKSRATAVRIRFVQPRAVPVGAFVQVAVTVARVDGTVLPASALQQDARGLFVWQVGDGSVVVRRPVSVAMQTPGRVVVKEPIGVQPVVAKAGAFLKEGDVVAAVKEQ